MLLHRLRRKSKSGKAARFTERGHAHYDRGEFLKALGAWRRGGESGNPEAQYRVGLLYARGEGVLRSTPDAVTWYQRAAEQGHVEAQFQLGLIYLHGARAHQGPNSPDNWLRTATN